MNALGEGQMNRKNGSKKLKKKLQGLNKRIKL